MVALVGCGQRRQKQAESNEGLHDDINPLLAKFSIDERKGGSYI
jgi:hypothetical protein